MGRDNGRYGVTGGTRLVEADEEVTRGGAGAARSPGPLRRAPVVGTARPSLALARAEIRLP